MPWTSLAVNLKGENGTCDSDAEGARKCTYGQAIRETCETLLLEDERFFILGEGVDDASGIFGTTLGLAEQFGRDRVVDIPLAENGMTGIAIGAAMAGMRPLFVHMRPDFLLLSLDQLLNHAAKWCYMSGGQVSVPLTIRCIIGRGWGSAAQHSQSVQGLLTHLPGLKVVMPASAYDAKGLLVAAINDPNPVIILEHRWLFDKQGYVPAGIYDVEIGKARVCREGRDITIVATSLMVHEAMQAAEKLHEKKINAEVIDLRSVKPWDEECVAESVRKTGRLLVADTGHAYGGVAGEVAAKITETCWHDLKCPPKRVTLPEAPVPAAHSLEALYFPGWEDVYEAVKNLCE